MTPVPASRITSADGEIIRTADQPELNRMTP
jgi:hypothetical protein